jgi:D-3-phosphoglycerate dehydrogenase
MRVLVSAPPYPLEAARELLEPAGANVDAAGARPWHGDDVVGLMTWERVDGADMARLPRLRVIATGSVGYDHIDVAEASRRGIWVCNVPDYCVDEMADSTIGLIVALVRGIVALDRSVRDGLWDDHAAGPLERLGDVRLGIVGFGRIGRAVAARARALGMEVWAHDALAGDVDIVTAGVRAVSLEQLLEGCNVVSLHVPLTSATANLIGPREIALMPRGAFLINTARAALLDETALLRALDSGALGGAAVDVLQDEPRTGERPAPRHPRLIVTPHSAWYSPRSEREVVRRAALAIRSVIEGGVPDGAVVTP